MRPEAAAGAREARGRVCHCPADGSRRPPPPPRGPESPTPWRPWVLTPRDAERTGTGSPSPVGRAERSAAGDCRPQVQRKVPGGLSLLQPGGDQRTSESKGAFGFQHPVRLYLPISKRQEYLQSSGEKVLASFPVQATIHFYNDESDPEDGEQEEEAQPCHLQGQEAEIWRKTAQEERAETSRHTQDRDPEDAVAPAIRVGFPTVTLPRGAQCASSK
ncbi:LOW QUALITY PROTEIN: protein ripply3 [Hipposideros larvatus]